jgi:hypothetical protein
VAVGCLVPPGFEAYARVLHPAVRETEHGNVPVRWSEVASENRTIAHPLMQFHRVARAPWPKDPAWGYAPEVGTLPAQIGERLIAHLRPCTSTASHCYLAVWEGYGVQELNALAGQPRLMLPHRNYFVFTAPIDAVTRLSIGSFEQPPNIWWPQDQAWCVATEVDANATLVGGSASCIERIVSDPQLEAFEVPVEARIDYDGDLINPAA